MSTQQQQATGPGYQSARHRAAARKNLEKAWQANRSRWEFTPARRATSLWTIKKAHFANRLPGRAFSPEHLAKLRESIAKARAARSDKSVERQAQKVLKHGLFARLLRGPVASLGENPSDYEALHRLVPRYLCPQNEEEEKVAHLIADSLWRQHRAFFAQAALQLKRLDFFLSKAPPLERPDPNETRLRAHTLVTVLLDDDDSVRRTWLLVGATERLLRRFLRLRFGRDPNFHTNSHASNLFARFSRAERDDFADTTDDIELFDDLDEKWL